MSVFVLSSGSSRRGDGSSSSAFATKDFMPRSESLRANSPLYIFSAASSNSCSVASGFNFFNSFLKSCISISGVIEGICSGCTVLPSLKPIRPPSALRSKSLSDCALFKYCSIVMKVSLSRSKQFIKFQPIFERVRKV